MTQLEREIDQSIRADVYQENGYKNRTEYLGSLAWEHEVSIETVRQYAYLLGPSEDFDGLVAVLMVKRGDV